MQAHPPTSVELRLCDSLEKVFPDEAPRPMDPSIPAVGYAGSRTNLQVALRAPRGEAVGTVVRPQVRVQCPPGVRARLHQVELVPVSVPAPAGAAPAEYLRTEPGLFPDLLRPLAAPGGVTGTVDVAAAADATGTVDLTFDAWHAVWVTLEIDDDATTAEAAIQIEVTDPDAEPVTASAPLRIVGEQLPELGLVNTHWFHCDGLISHYDLEPFSDRYWQVIENFLASAARMSVNSVLTPVWTPPLDTAVGAERLPTQLLGITDDGDGAYRFDPTQLDRWLEVTRRVGITHLEVPHLFTQWGAKATPAIYVDTPDGRVRRFGWDVTATDPSYRRLVEQLLPYLIDHLETSWGLDRVIFHISDEPNEQNLAGYEAARDVVADLLADVTVVDALSSYEFYRRGLVDHPIASTDHAQPFLDADVEDLWVYYCVSQNAGVANRFIAQPSARNRALGAQLYMGGAGGFLHWGFNFYNAQFSTRPLNPYLDTCAAGGFPGGDAFMVYPGAGGVPVASIRYEVFAEAMTDHRAAQLLEKRVGREAARQVLGTAWADGYDLPPVDPDDVRALALAVAERVAG